MSAIAARIGPATTIRCRTISPSSSSPTISTGWSTISTTPSRRVPMLGTAGAVEGHQRADPLCARRQPADRPDAGRAQRLRGLRLHLRHRPGRRRRQGAGRMGHARARPNGTCGPATRAASPPLPSAPDYCVAKGMEIYGNEYAIQFPAPCLAGRPRPQAVADPRPHQGARRPVQRL